MLSKCYTFLFLFYRFFCIMYFLIMVNYHYMHYIVRCNTIFDIIYFFVQIWDRVVLPVRRPCGGGGAALLRRLFRNLTCCADWTSLQCIGATFNRRLFRNLACCAASTSLHGIGTTFKRQLFRNQTKCAVWTSLQGIGATFKWRLFRNQTKCAVWTSLQALERRSSGDFSEI